MTFSEEFESIKAAIYDNPRQDPGRLETCLSIALEALHKIGDECCHCPLGDVEEQCLLHGAYDPRVAVFEFLRRVEMRVRLGDDIRPGEQQTLEWPYETVLDADERGGR